MSGFQCPYCSTNMAISSDTLSKRKIGFESNDGIIYSHTGHNKKCDSCLEISFYKCPNCNQYTIKVIGTGDSVDEVNVPIRPISPAKQFPDYIPEGIRQDYEEACAIMSLSPKASATLSRRCLQGMIRDFWGISKTRLVDEINELQNKNSSPTMESY